jgi:hypothetical protein
MSMAFRIWRHKVVEESSSNSVSAQDVVVIGDNENGKGNNEHSCEHKHCRSKSFAKRTDMTTLIDNFGTCISSVHYCD